MFVVLCCSFRFSIIIRNAQGASPAKLCRLLGYMYLEEVKIRNSCCYRVVDRRRRDKVNNVLFTA